jgi:hypothetical protein
MQTIEQFRQELAELAASKPQPAQQLASQGRGGDSMLVHMRPDEVAAMQNMAQQAGTSMTVNPVTGLPEAFKLKDLFNINTYTDPIQKGMKSVGLGGLYDTVSDAASWVGKNAQYILPFIPGGAFASVGLGSLATPMGKGILGGLAGTFANGRPNLKRGLMAGLTSYGLSSAYEGLQAAGGGAPSAAGASYDSFGNPVESGSRAAMSADVSGVDPSGAVSANAKRPLTAEFDAATQGVKNLMSSDKAVAKAATEAFKPHFGRGTGYATMMGVTGTMDLDAQEAQLEAARAANQIAEADYARMKARIAEARRRAEDAVRANPYRFAMGGMPLAMKGAPENELNPYGGMARGGVPRFIDGEGDGMSDSVPAMIDGQQPAQLADGEFVIPADVVSHLGNGSTKAGAKQLYAMMDRVRQARTGTEQQGREIVPTKYTPA